VITGELDGYIEPCGCTGKENQKGGLSRRQNFLRAVQSAGWPLVAVDLGGQVKRFGRQSEVKFQSIADGLRAMGYSAVGLGPDDLRLPAEELVAAVAPVGDQPTPFLSANVGLLGLDANITPRYRVVEIGGLKIGITSVLGDKELADRSATMPSRSQPAARVARGRWRRNSPRRAATTRCCSRGRRRRRRRSRRRFPQFDYRGHGRGRDEPPPSWQLPGGWRPGSPLVELGHKGMFAVAIGFFDDPATSAIAAGAARRPLGRVART
jgi:hypothetical protein